MTDDSSPASLLREARRHYKRHRFEDAAILARRALEINPDSPDVLIGLATILLKEPGGTGEAEQLFRRAEALDPAHPALPNNLGVLAWSRGDFPAAEQYFRRAVELEPNQLQTRINFANALRRVGKPDDAISQYREALRIKPGEPRTNANLASVLEQIGSHQESLQHYSLALRARPDMSKARYARGMLLLKLGRLREGWRDFEWRFEATGHDYLDEVTWQFPIWQGERFTGKRLLVFHEQGLGDAVHFARYLPKVKELGGEVILKCGPPLFRLFESLPSVDRVITRRRRLAADEIDYDLHVPLLSLPRIFDTTLESIPANVPYLSVPPALRERWAHRVDPRSFNVGIVWSGKAAQANNDARSCRLEDLRPLFEIPGVRLFSLQKGEGRPQLADHADRFPIIDYTNELTDLAETAALMENLDLIVSVDTITAHLAGALGRPVWTLLCTTHCWRYLLNREDSPWYPSMVLFRQSQAGDWSEPVRAICDRLTSLMDDRTLYAGGRQPTD